MPTSLTQLEQALKHSKSLAELEDAFKKYLKSWHISGYTFSFYAPIKNKKNKLLYQLCSPRMKSWHDYYYQENFDKVDQTQNETSKSLIPIFWQTKQQLAEAKTEKDRKLRQESVDLGVIQGLSIPIHDASGEYAELTLRQFKEETCLDQWQHHKYEWHIATLYYQHYLKSYLLSDLNNNKNLHLTKREQQCLNLLVKNYTTHTIAKTLKMTERTVNFHIQNINHKLGTRNKYQTIAKIKQLNTPK